MAASPEGEPYGFPEPWRSFLDRVPATHKMVWTYMELGMDLGGQPDPRRRNLMGSLIKYLDLPPGPVAFWPVAVLRDGALQPDRTMFWKGWQQWRTPNVVCFGQEALRVILPDADPSLTTHMLDEVMVHVMPGVEALIAMLPHERQLAVDRLIDIR